MQLEFDPTGCHTASLHFLAAEAVECRAVPVARDQLISRTSVLSTALPGSNSNALCCGLLLSPGFCTSDIFDLSLLIHRIQEERCQLHKSHRA